MAFEGGGLRRSYGRKGGQLEAIGRSEEEGRELKVREMEIKEK